MRNAKTDANQKDVISALRKMGCTVESLHRVGGGVPDLLVGFRGKNYLFEVKVEGGKLNDTQHAWISSWRGSVYIVRSVDDAVGLINAFSLM